MLFRSWLKSGIGCVVAGLVVGAAGWLCAQPLPVYEQPPINYSNAETDNDADALHRAFGSGEFDEAIEGGSLTLLRELLDEFRIPEESQVLVFSKTSLQRDGISPDRPRSIYFSDDAYLGYVRNGLYELTVNDPELGLVFYAVDAQAKSVTRSRDCMSCHGGSRTDDWPGVFVRSIYPDETGDLSAASGSFVTTHESPFEERWGGWYVTGQHGKSRHLGNAIAMDHGRGAEIDMEPGANLDDLTDRFDAEYYLRPDSDIVALMVLEHQCEMHNRLSRARLRAIKWIEYQRILDAMTGEDVTDGVLRGSAKRVVESEAERIVEYMLFCDEARLPREGIQGAGDFEEAFRSNRRENAEGNSLKDFDLNRRLFRYRCSYMIYSEAFENLPDTVKEVVFTRLADLLTMDEVPEKYEHIHGRERRIIREILWDTKPEMRSYLRSR